MLDTDRGDIDGGEVINSEQSLVRSSQVPPTHLLLEVRLGDRGTCLGLIRFRQNKPDIDPHIPIPMFQFQCFKYSKFPKFQFQCYTCSQLSIVTDVMEARERERGRHPSGTCLMASSPNFNRLLHDRRPNITIIIISSSIISISIIISINQHQLASRSIIINIKIILTSSPNSNCLLDDERANICIFTWPNATVHCSLQFHNSHHTICYCAAFMIFQLIS